MFKSLLLFFQVKEQLAGQMIDILNPGKVSKWKVRKSTTGAINTLKFKIFFQGDLVPERLKNLEKKREKEAAERKEQERQVLFSKLLGAKCFIKVLIPIFLQARERLELLRQQAAAAALEVKPFLID